MAAKKTNRKKRTSKAGSTARKAQPSRKAETLFFIWRLRSVQYPTSRSVVISRWSMTAIRKETTVTSIIHPSPVIVIRELNFFIW